MTRDGARGEAPPTTIDSVVATGRGDDGTTGLLFGGPRIQKDDPRTEAYGTVDEAVAALGLARAELGTKDQYGVLNPSLAEIGEVILRIQRELFVVGAELATTPDAWGRLEDGRTRVSAEMVAGLTVLLEDLERRIDDAPRIRGPGRDPDQRRARAGAHDPAARRASGRHARTRGIAARSPPATVSEPSGRPRLGPCPGGRTGGGADQHAGPARRRRRTSSGPPPATTDHRPPPQRPEPAPSEERRRDDPEPEPTRTRARRSSASDPPPRCRPGSSPSRSAGCSPGCC